MQDFICNWLGNRRWVDAMQWSGAEGWSAAEDLDWEEGGEPAGLFTKSGPLSFVKVFDAGHMVRPRFLLSLSSTTLHVPSRGTASPLIPHPQFLDTVKNATAAATCQHNSSIAPSR